MVLKRPKDSCSLAKIMPSLLSKDDLTKNLEEKRSDKWGRNKSGKKMGHDFIDWFV